MSEREKEALSALLDNEAGDLELRRLLKAMDESPEIAVTWSRYNLVQSVLHDVGTPVNSSLIERINQQLQSEAPLSVITSGSASSASAWQQGLSKMAIAASVAAVFVVTFQTSLPSPAVPELAQQESSSFEQITPQPAATRVAESVNFAVDPAAQQRLLEYIERVTFDAEQPVRTEHIQDSPLFRLVNELQSRSPANSTPNPR
ncbi:MAG: sigma-E factor negative regulatory protein [Proteobacteria bacterium]|nr:sigma-E factor negative regulatory protein [Pseudomonadota bacterium]